VNEERHYGVYVPGHDSQWQIIGMFTDVEGACAQAGNILKSDQFSRIEIANVTVDKHTLKRTVDPDA
jgi:hypothetical protein